MENKVDEYYDTGYTEDVFAPHVDIRRYARFIATLVRFDLMPIRNGQILMSNYGQKRFNQLRDEDF